MGRAKPEEPIAYTSRLHQDFRERPRSECGQREALLFWMDRKVRREPAIKRDPVAACVAEPAPDLMKSGVVLRVNSGVYTVHDQSIDSGAARCYRCVMRGNLKKSFTFSTSGSRSRRVVRARQPLHSDAVAVGDFV